MSFRFAIVSVSVVANVIVEIRVDKPFVPVLTIVLSEQQCALSSLYGINQVTFLPGHKWV